MKILKGNLQEKAVVVLDALPRTSSGKLQKFALARMVRERVAAGQPSD